MTHLCFTCEYVWRNNIAIMDQLTDTNVIAVTAMLRCTAVNVVSQTTVRQISADNR